MTLLDFFLDFNHLFNFPCVFLLFWFGCPLSTFRGTTWPNQLNRFILMHYHMSKCFRPSNSLYTFEAVVCEYLYFILDNRSSSHTAVQRGIGFEKSTISDPCDLFLIPDILSEKNACRFSSAFHLLVDVLLPNSHFHFQLEILTFYKISYKQKSQENFL